MAPKRLYNVAFIEHEQDRGNKITTIRTTFVGVQAFLHYLVEEEIIPPNIFGRRIRLQVPEQLPRAMNPNDLLSLLSVIKGTRDRAIILVLLRTGMRIGELLNRKRETPKGSLSPSAAFRGAWNVTPAKSE